MVTVGLNNLMTCCSISLNREIKALPLETEIETICKVGHTVTKVNLIVVVNLTIVVNVIVLHVAWFYISLEHTITTGNPVVDFLLVLENTCCFISPEVTDSMTILSAIELRCIVVELVGSAMNDTIVSRNAAHLVLVICTIHASPIAEVLTNHIVPSQVKLKTFILYITAINSRCTCSYCSQNWSCYQPVFGCLDIVIKVDIQVSANHSGIDTDI